LRSWHVLVWGSTWEDILDLGKLYWSASLVIDKDSLAGTRLREPICSEHKTGTVH